MKGLLSLMTFVPMIGAIAILFTDRKYKDAIRTTAAVATGIPLFLSLVLMWNFDKDKKPYDWSAGLASYEDQAEAAGFQFVESHVWIDRLSEGAMPIKYYMGVDGLSYPMVLLTALLSFFCVFAAWNIEKGVKGFFALFLLLETGMMGVFCSLDFFLFYVFWEVMLLPMYFLIGVWGGPRKEYAAIKFFLYTLFGSVLMLIAMLAFYFGSEPHTFDLIALTHKAPVWASEMRMALFLAFFIAFAVKVPVFPFHTWLPDAHVEAPTAISAILAGVLLKMGLYGMLRINFPLLPEAFRDFGPWLAALGFINIVYGALCAMAQKDLKKMVAYSSISHLGFCLLGIAAVNSYGMIGCVFQMFAHGLTSAMLFLLVGVVYDRAHHRNIDGFGGLGVVMPVYTGITALAFMASLGLPALCGFVGEALSLLGGWGSTQYNLKWITLLSATGIVFTAGYFLWAFQRVFLGPLNEKYRTMPDANPRELFTLIPIGILVIVFGIFPALLITPMSAALNTLVGMLRG